MCGICGWVALEESAEAPDLERMARTLTHRGPDQQGFYREQHVGLAIRRLKIIALEGGRQPYSNEDGSIQAVFNGELYNFRELRERLEKRGHRFQTEADGEILVHLYEEYGQHLVEPINGMFAAAVYDRRRRRLLLFRDRFGIKPLYYALDRKRLLFASELKAILAVEGFPRTLDRAALRQYLTFEYVPAPRSIFARIQKLRPAHRLVIDRDRVDLKAYWSVRFEPAPDQHLDRWCEEFRERLLESVRLRLISDVPLGMFLSGGLDSSSLTRLMCQLQPGRVKTFSIGFQERSYDESLHFREVASFLGTDHHDRILEPRTTQQVLEPLLDVLDEPLGDAAIVPTYLLSQFAREQVTVALSGEGADELLGGYPTYWAHQLAGWFRLLPSPLLAAFSSAVEALPVSRRYLSLDYKLKRFVSGLELPPRQRHLNWMGSFPHRGDALLRHPLEVETLEPLRYLAQDSAPGTATIQALDVATYLADDLLVKLDRATMAWSLEGRVPFLDHTLVEFLARLPEGLKFRGPNAKLALKRALGKELPKRTVKRAKKGFGIPVADWMRGDLRPLVERYLGPDYVRRQDLFREGPIRRLIDDHNSFRVDNRKQLWTLLVFQLWHERYQPTL